MFTKKISRTLFITIIALISLAFLTAALPQGLPPRPTPEPPPAVNSQPDGTLIQLTISSSDTLPASTWTAVQWQDPAGDWHFVNGWQGNPDHNNQVTWWVDSSDLGSGPFRWLVFEDASQTNILYTTDGFTLPAQAGQLLQETAVLP